MVSGKIVVFLLSAFTSSILAATLKANQKLEPDEALNAPLKTKDQIKRDIDQNINQQEDRILEGLLNALKARSPRETCCHNPCDHPHHHHPRPTSTPKRNEGEGRKVKLEEMGKYENPVAVARARAPFEDALYGGMMDKGITKLDVMRAGKGEKKA